MSILRFKFTPRIAFFDLPEDPRQSADQTDEKPYPTGNPQLDELILHGLLNDRIGFKNVFGVPGLEGSGDYRYDPVENVIELWAKKPNKIPITPKELADELHAISPNGGGPDTWMESNVEIVDEEIANDLGYELIELHPYVSYVGVLYPDGEGTYTGHPVDLSKLPHPS